MPAPEHVPRMVPNIPPQDNPGDMSAPRALAQGLDIMPQPIPHENAVPCTIGNGLGTSPDARVGATSAGVFEPESDMQ